MGGVERRGQTTLLTYAGRGRLALILCAACQTLQGGEPCPPYCEVEERPQGYTITFFDCPPELPHGCVLSVGRQAD